MIEHGVSQNRDWRNGRIGCKCGREFDSDRGLMVHLGKTRKLSNMVLEREIRMSDGKVLEKKPE